MKNRFQCVQHAPNGTVGGGYLHLFEWEYLNFKESKTYRQPFSFWTEHYRFPYGAEEKELLIRTKAQRLELLLQDLKAAGIEYDLVAEFGRESGHLDGSGHVRDTLNFLLDTSRMRPGYGVKTVPRSNDSKQKPLIRRRKPIRNGGRGGI